MYIYTSGTTGNYLKLIASLSSTLKFKSFVGLPKPGVIKQFRYLGGALTFHRAAKLDENDIVYVALPIYHGNGGLIGIGNAIVCGSTVVLRRKFSATNFWKECIEHNCTVCTV